MRSAISVVIVMLSAYFDSAKCGALGWSKDLRDEIGARHRFDLDSLESEDRYGPDWHINEDGIAKSRFNSHSASGGDQVGAKSNDLGRDFASDFNEVGAKSSSVARSRSDSPVAASFPKSGRRFQQNGKVKSNRFESEWEEFENVTSPPRPFRYDYNVDELSKDLDKIEHSRSESSDGTQVNGEYRIRLDDGRVQIVTYTAGLDGFNSKVTYEGEARQVTQRPSFTDRPAVVQQASRSRHRDGDGDDAERRDNGQIADEVRDSRLKISRVGQKSTAEASREDGRDDRMDLAAIDWRTSDDQDSRTAFAEERQARPKSAATRLSGQLKSQEDVDGAVTGKPIRKKLNDPKWRRFDPKKMADFNSDPSSADAPVFTLPDFAQAKQAGQQRFRPKSADINWPLPGRQRQTRQKFADDDDDDADDADISDVWLTSANTFANDVQSGWSVEEGEFANFRPTKAKLTHSFEDEDLKLAIKLADSFEEQDKSSTLKTVWDIFAMLREDELILTN